MRWSGSSSAFTPTGRIRALGRIPGWGCRSPNRSSKPMAGASGRKTAPGPAGADGEADASPARASWSGCRRHDDAAAASVHASAVLVGERAVLIRGPSGVRQIAAGVRSHPRRARAGKSPRPCWSATIVSISKPATGSLMVRPAPRTGRPDRDPRARHSPLRLCRGGRRRTGRRSLRRRCRAPAAAGSASDTHRPVSKYREFP